MKAQDSDNPYIVLRRVFVDFAFTSHMIIYTKITFVFHFLTLLLETYYMITNFNVELFSRYGCMMCLMTYIVLAKLLEILFARHIKFLEEERLSHFWKLEESSEETQKVVNAESSKIRKKTFFVLSWFVALGFVLFPIFGDLNDLFMFGRVYRNYFGSWAIIPFCIYVSTFPSIAYNSICLPAVVSYFIFHLNLQISLINDKLGKISEKSRQSEIYQKLCSCVAHHVRLRRWTNIFQNELESALPFYLFLGAINSIAVSFFILYNLQNMTLIFEIRLVVISVCNVLILWIFAEAGQEFSDNSDSIFDAVVACPWYSWNAQNRKIMLIFMLNCLKPMTFSWGGVKLDYQFTVTIVKMSYSYALVLYNWRYEK
ncbi:odorant receptor 171 [Tribolium castaneum]|uniref:Odorant receptor n=1 Tax=Tribolium castaneum TaxID=7070 RepID=D6WEN4_TRICA|nr:odorant receptor 171 [Tribolium castaneum]